MLGSIIASVAPAVIGTVASKVLGGGRKSSSSAPTPAPAPAGGSGGSGDSFAQGFITGINAAPEGSLAQTPFPFDAPGAPVRMAEAQGVEELIKLLDLELGGSPGMGGDIQRDISRSPAHLFPQVVSEALRASRDFS